MMAPAERMKELLGIGIGCTERDQDLPLGFVVSVPGGRSTNLAFWVGSEEGLADPPPPSRPVEGVASVSALLARLPEQLGWVIRAGL